MPLEAAAALHPRRPGSSPRGFTLVEVLIAIVLVAFSMLGVARLQLGALQAGRLGLDMLATQGHVLGLADRLRALHGASPEVRLGLAGNGADHACRGTVRCTPKEFAEFEAWSWREESDLLRDARALPIEASGEVVPVRYTLRIARPGASEWSLEVAT